MRVSRRSVLLFALVLTVRSSLADPSEYYFRTMASPDSLERALASPSKVNLGLPLHRVHHCISSESSQ